MGASRASESRWLSHQLARRGRGGPVQVRTGTTSAPSTGGGRRGRAHRCRPTRVAPGRTGRSGDRQRATGSTRWAPGPGRLRPGRPAATQPCHTCAADRVICRHIARCGAVHGAIRRRIARCRGRPSGHGEQTRRRPSSGPFAFLPVGPSARSAGGPALTGSSPGPFRLADRSPPAHLPPSRGPDAGSGARPGPDSHLAVPLARGRTSDCPARPAPRTTTPSSATQRASHGGGRACLAASPGRRCAPHQPLRR